MSFNVKKGRFYGYENRKILLRQLFIWLFRGNAIYALICVAYSLLRLIVHNLVNFRAESNCCLVMEGFELEQKSPDIEGCKIVCLR